MTAVPHALSESLANQYRIERVLGSGGMATVYLAHDVRHDRQVAVKVVKPEIVATVGADRFINEIRTTAHLKHPHVLPLFDSGSTGDALFYVMPYIDGESLRSRLRREGQLPLTDTMTILREVADALAYAHARGVIHRDIKPDNVLLSGRHVFLADFGIARVLEASASVDQTVTATSTIVGTPAYLSPEQAAGRSHIDHRAWTPDGRGLLFVSSRNGGRDVYRQRLARSGVPEGEPERVTSGLNAHAIALSRDGKRLAYSSLTFRANVWSLPIPSQAAASVAEAKQVTFGSEKTEKLVVSRDRKWLAYDSDRSGNADVWKLRIARGEPEQVTRDPSPEFANDWSPDGLEILFHTIRGATHRDLMRSTADGTRTSAVVATSAHEQHGSYSPDGNSIAFSSGPGTSDLYYLFVISRESGSAPWGPPRPLTSDIGVDPKWSPDGGRILFTRRGELHVILPNGREDRAIVSRSTPDQPLPQYGIWSTDSKTIYFKAADAERRASIWAVPAEGGTPRLLVRFDDPQKPSLRREFATDGVRFFFTIAQDESDIWVAEVK